MLVCGDLRVQRMFGKYEIGRLLGEGAFGMVFEARAVSSDRRVALKQISKEGVRREEVMSGAVSVRLVLTQRTLEYLALLSFLFSIRNAQED